MKAAKDGAKFSPAQADVLLAPRPAIELYDTQRDPYQLNNLAGKPEHAPIQAKLAAALKKWMDETGDSVPDEVSHDNFDNRTGRRISKNEADYRRPAPGTYRGADRINKEGL